MSKAEKEDLIAEEKSKKKRPPKNGKPQIH